MASPHIKCLLLSLCLCTLLLCDEARQFDRLRQLMKSRQTFNVSDDAAWLDSSKLMEEVFVQPQQGSMEADKIDQLPGQPEEGVPFNQYAGYITVDAKAGRALFYYLVEAPHKPSSKPLLLWLNGGPGCSSLGFGAMTELGPFRANPDGKTLHANPYAWNHVANVIFLETPAGVGFSYSNKSSDYGENRDTRTASDSYAFLVNWMERFPHYKNREFFLAGESYAGHYVPQLATTIIRRNEARNTTIINLKGIAIGNGYLDGMTHRYDTNTKGMYEYLWAHAMISSESYLAIQRECNYPNGVYTTKCERAIGTADYEAGDIDEYSIYAPLCRSNASASACEFDPCSDDYVESYLNRPEVQRALHVKTRKAWKACGTLLWNDAASTALPIVKNVISHGISTLLYSGDVDSVVPVTSTRYYIDMLKLPIIEPWRAWYSNNDVGGYVVRYKGLTFATVRGAGHEVPSYQPERSLTMITAFLQGKLPPPQ